MTDLSPRETAARAAVIPFHDVVCSLGAGCRDDVTTYPPVPRALIDAVLAAVAAHDGLAEVLRDGLADFAGIDPDTPIIDVLVDGLADVVRAWMVQT